MQERKLSEAAFEEQTCKTKYTIHTMLLYGVDLLGNSRICKFSRHDALLAALDRSAAACRLRSDRANDVNSHKYQRQASFGDILL